MPSQMHPAKAIFFDLDGTLVDSKPDVLGAFGFAFSALGLGTPPEDKAGFSGFARRRQIGTCRECAHLFVL